jgi:ribosomal protein S18 acetylase RimI-like enzyme
MNAAKTPMSLRDLNGSDISACLKIERKSFATERWSRADFEREIAAATVKRGVTDEHGLPQGYIICKTNDLSALEIINIVVAKKGNGYGSALIGEILDREPIILRVRANNVPAIRFYKKFDFFQELRMNQVIEMTRSQRFAPIRNFRDTGYDRVITSKVGAGFAC